MKRILLNTLTIALLNFGANAQNVNIPDANFKAYLVGNTAINTNGDTEIQVTEAHAFTSQIWVPNLGISDLTGIEAFIQAFEINCGNNQLTSINLTQNIALTKLSCNNNQLTSLDITQNTGLITLGCNNNQLTSLDLTQNTALTVLACYSNPLGSLNVGSNVNLTQLFCYGNQLTSIDVSQNVALEYFYLYSNPLTNLNVSQNVSLIDILCYNTQLTSLDLSQNTALTSVWCQNSQLTSLNVANGSNINIADNYFHAAGNPSLTCIQVDDVAWSTANWASIDATASYNVDCGLGIDENNQLSSRINIYPNPASEMLNIDTKENIKEIKIFNLFGELVQTETSNSFSINELASGVYFINVVTDNGVEQMKFIKN